MTSTKALTYLHLLDAARCNSDWDSVPELVRKINKHAGAARKCLTQTALLDHDLCPQRLSHTLHKNSTIVASSSALSRASITPGGTTSVSSSTLVSLTQLAKLLEDEIARFKVENAAAAAAAENAANIKESKWRNKGAQHVMTSEEDIYQSEVTLAYLHYLLKAPRVVLQVLPQAAPSDDVITQEWTRVCIIKALCIRGLCMESLGRKVEALLVYRSLPLPDLTRGAGGAVEAGGEASYWTRKALARFAVLSWEIFRGEYGPSEIVEEEIVETPESEDNQIEPMGAADGAAEVIRHVKRDSRAELAREKELQETYHLDEGQLLGAFRAYHAFSTSLSSLRPMTAASATSLTTLSAAKINKEEENSRREIYRTYLHVVSTLIKSAAERNEAVSKDMEIEVQAVEDIYESLLLKGTSFPRADAVNEEVLNWVDTVVANWENTGEKGDEAQRVVEILYRASQKTFHSPRILRHLFVTLAAAGNFHDALLSFNTYITLILAEKARLAKGGPPNPDAHDFDPDNIILATGVTGIRFLVKYFNDKAQRAIEIAALLKGWIFEWQIEHQETLALVWRGVGLANAASARQTAESSQRTELQERAVAAFRKSLEYTPERIDILFDLAMALAEVREINDAIAAVRVVVEQQEKCIPAWHLLALLLTARQEWDTAFNITEAVFAVMDEATQLLDIGVGGKEGLLEIKITQMAIVEVVEGPEAAVNLADELLRLYTRLFPGTIQTNGDVSTPVVVATNASPPKTPVPTTPGRGRPLTSHTQHTAAPTIEVTTESGRKRSRSNRRSRASSMPGMRRKELEGAEPMPPPPPRAAEEGDVSNAANVAGDDARAFSREPVNNRSTGATPQASPQTSPQTTPQKHTPNKLHRTNTGKTQKSTKGSLRNRRSMPEKPPAPIKGTDTKQVGEHEHLHSQIDGAQDDSHHNLPVEKLPHPIQQVDDDRPLLPRPWYLREPVLGEKDEKARIKTALLRIWLVISGLYRRAEMWDDAGVAVEEAANLGGAEDADVLAEKGFLAAAQNLDAQASSFYESALAYEPDHPLATVGLARQLLQVKTETIAARDRASGLLSSLTKLGAGWDMSEAWFELAECYERAGQTGKAKEVLWWCVKLEDTRPVRAWKNVRPRVL